VAARRAHNPKVGGSNPPAATRRYHCEADVQSLETPVGEDGEGTLGALIEDKDQRSPADVAVETLLHRDLEAALAELTERERMILTLRYGLVDSQPRTLEMVGRAMGMTRERARQIEAEALRKLRTSDTWRHLREYLA
jgi:RNA polymerase primary sigma factor